MSEKGDGPVLFPTVLVRFYEKEFGIGYCVPDLAARLEGLLDLAQVVALGRDPFEKIVVEGSVHLRRPAQDPEVFPVGMADDGPLIVLVELDDPVGAGERPEEADLELGVGRLVDDPGLAADRALLAVERLLAAGVDDVDIPVVAKRIVGRDADAALLEALGDGRDLVPRPEVPLNVDRGHDLERLLLGPGLGGSARGDDEHQDHYPRFHEYSLCKHPSSISRVRTANHLNLAYHRPIAESRCGTGRLTIWLML